MSPAELLEAVKDSDLPTINDWSQYKGVYFHLITQPNVSKRAAINRMAEKLKLSDEDREKLYRASKHWNR